MSVLVKGMEMPIDGNETIIRVQPDGTVLDQYGHHLAITAIPVPPHGRLIDSDELIQKLNDEHISYNSDINFFITNAPTVIEVEE